MGVQIAAFRATLEEISEASLLLHVVDVSHPMARSQIAAVESVLAELDVGHIPLLTVWNKVSPPTTPPASRGIPRTQFFCAYKASSRRKHSVGHAMLGLARVEWSAGAKMFGQKLQSIVQELSEDHSSGNLSEVWWGGPVALGLL